MDISNPALPGSLQPYSSVGYAASTDLHWVTPFPVGSAASANLHWEVASVYNPLPLILKPVAYGQPSVKPAIVCLVLSLFGCKSIKKRLCQAADRMVLEEAHGGFRKNCQTVDHLFVVNESVSSVVGRVGKHG